jgi:hypothetical protein
MSASIYGPASTFKLNGVNFTNKADEHASQLPDQFPILILQLLNMTIIGFMFLRNYMLILILSNNYTLNPRPILCFPYKKKKKNQILETGIMGFIFV